MKFRRVTLSRLEGLWGNRRRRLVLLWATSLLLGYGVFLHPLREDLRAQAILRDRLAAAVEKERRFVAGADALSRELERVERVLTRRREVLWPESLAEGPAFSAVQERIRELVGTSGAVLRSQSWGQAERVNGVTRLPVRTVIAGTPAQIAAIVSEVSAAPALRFSDLSLKRDPVREGLLVTATFVGYQSGAR